LALLAIGFAGNLAWRKNAPRIAHESHYILSAENIHLTPAPPWIRSDIKSQVLRDAGLEGTISILDDGTSVVRRVKEAFEFHPWIASVEKITKRLPSALYIELRYRRPVAAVESPDVGGVTYLPVDEQAIRLPEIDLTEAERRYLPRISGVIGRPLVGDPWDDPRVVGGAKLAAALGDVWRQLRLVEIMATLQDARVEQAESYAFEIVSSGGTRIVWGAAPGQESAFGESTLEAKRQRLLEYAAQHGKLESIDGPERLDVRSDLVVTPRTARRSTATR
jgi:hypothetical protein